MTGARAGLLHHVVAGTGSPPLVLVHGFGCSHTDWGPKVAYFGSRHTTVAVDLPGHGATPPPAGEASIDVCGRELVALLRALQLPPAVLVGHSMGCRVVLEAALAAPAHVAALVLVDGSQFQPLALQAFETRFAAGEYKVLVRDLFEQMFTERTDASLAAALLRRALELPEDLGRALLLSLARYDIERLGAALEQVDRPMLVLQSTFVDAQRRRRPLGPGQTTPYLDFVRGKARRVRVEVVTGIGHFPQLDASADTNRILESFVAELA